MTEESYVESAQKRANRGYTLPEDLVQALKLIYDGSTVALVRKQGRF